MLLSTFYDLINNELSSALTDNAQDERTKTHKDPKQNKGYAMLIWFLKFYGQKELYKSYITDGKDDSSCDIIFSNKNVQDEELFYVVQSKYIDFDTTKNQEKAFPKIKKEEFGSALNDFSVILGGEKNVGKNKEFNRKYKELRNHLEQNGKVKFIFFTLANHNSELEEAVEAFNRNYAPNVSLEVIDIERMRRDYIEFKYKEIETSNPLEYNYSPEDAPIELAIERLKDSKRDIFEFEGRDKAYILLLKPKTVYELFKKYKFSLFFKNVRNPIHRSNYNQKIVDTLLKKPNAFWYFNNGITAITKIVPDIGVHAKKIELEGLQIINGAQTVYSIYKAYEQASPLERKSMDNYAKVALRLIGSGDEEFNMQITRYTNLQNPMHDRDFWANDEIQQRLQNKSFETNFWYEKRQDEFRLDEAQQDTLGIHVLPNTIFVFAYVVFHLQTPIFAIHRGKDFFISRRDDKDGLYEEIFNEKTRFEDMFASLFIFNILSILKGLIIENIDKKTLDYLTPTLALSKIVMQKYYESKFTNEPHKPLQLSKFLLNLSKANKKEDRKELMNILAYTQDILEEQLNNDAQKFNSLMNNAVFYENIKHKIEEGEIAIDIEAIKNYSKKNNK